MIKETYLSIYNTYFYVFQKLIIKYYKFVKWYRYHYLELRTWHKWNRMNYSIALSHWGSTIAKSLTSLLVFISKSPFLNGIASIILWVLLLTLFWNTKMVFVKCKMGCSLICNNLHEIIIANYSGCGFLHLLNNVYILSLYDAISNWFICIF